MKKLSDNLDVPLVYFLVLIIVFINAISEEFHFDGSEKTDVSVTDTKYGTRRIVAA